MNASLAVDVVSAVGSSVVDKSTISVDWSVLSFISIFLFSMLLNIAYRVIFLELSSTGISISIYLYLHIYRAHSDGLSCIILLDKNMSF